MLASLSRSRAPGTRDEVRSLSDQLATLQARDEALLAWVEALAEGRYDAPGVRDDDRLSNAIARLSARLAESASKSLDSIVDINIQSNETAISAARMLTACQDVDQRTQALAAASEEMVASVGQIRTTADDALERAGQMKASAEQGMSTVRSASRAMRPCA